MMRGVMKKISSWLEVCHRTMLEQVAKVRDIPEQRHLRDAQRVLGLDHAANHHRAAVGHQHLRGRLLRDQGRVAADLRGRSQARCFPHPR